MAQKLKPEQSQAVELQLAYYLKNIDSHISFNISRTLIKDAVTLRITTDQLWFVPINKGKTKIMTYEFEATKFLLKKFRFINKGSYIKFNLTHNRKKVLQDDNLTWLSDSYPLATYNVFGKLNYSDRLSFNFNIHGMYFNKKNRTPEYLKDINNYDFGGGESFIKFDIGFIYRLTSKENNIIPMDLSLKINNIFDENYYKGAYIKHEIADYFIFKGIQQPGRSYELKLTTIF